MKVVMKLYTCIGIFLLLATTPVCAFMGKTFLTNRSQSENSARLFAGWPFVSIVTEQARAKRDAVAWSFIVTPEYTETWKPSKIANYFFGCDSIAVSGSRVLNRGAHDVLADYWGLPPYFKSVLHFKPVIKNFLVDFMLNADLSAWVDGLYVIVHAPLVYTRWNLHMQEDIEVMDSNNTTNFYPAGYLSSQRLAPSQLTQSATQFLQGQAIFGDVQTPLMYGLIKGEQRRVRLAEIQAILRWDFLNKEDCRLGFQVQGAAPTGNRPQGCYLFEPIVGNGKHWELGIGADGYVSFWESKRASQRLGLYWQVVVNHFFTAYQRRSFDLAPCGPGSRYTLLEEVRTPVCNLDVPVAVPAVNQYQTRLSYAVNKTTLDCQISVPAEADVLIELKYRWCGLDAELGYNFWLRMAERLNGRKKIKENKYAAKGDAQLYGFSGTFPIAVNATQSNATLHGGQGAGNANYVNNNANFPTTAFDGSGGTLEQLNSTDSIELDIAQSPIQGSSPAVLLQDSDINDCSALSPKAVSHKFFAHIGYAGKEHTRCWAPYVGIGIEAEFACICFSNNSALSQWGAWARFGVAY